jgi:hypothetical protein
MQYNFGQNVQQSKVSFNLKSYHFFPSTLFSFFYDLKKRNQFKVNSEIYHTDTMQHTNFHQHSMSLTNKQNTVNYLRA